MAFCSSKIKWASRSPVKQRHDGSSFSPTHARVSARMQMVIALTRTIGNRMIEKAANKKMTPAQQELACYKIIGACLDADRRTSYPAELHMTMSKASKCLNSVHRGNYIVTGI